MTDELEALVAAVRSSPKYGTLDPAFVRSVGRVELAKRRSLKEAIKSTKGKLHQVAGAYLDTPIDYGGVAARLRQSRDQSGPEALRRGCGELMRRHSSTRERLPFLDAFYQTLLGGLGPIHRVLDLACGLNPLAIPWMPLAEGCRYDAYDVYEDLVRFLDDVLPSLGVEGGAHLADLTRVRVDELADVALLLKCLPCLEQLDRHAGERVLGSLRARYLVVSFPVRSLCGRSTGMARAYDARLRDLVSGRSWQVERFEFPDELAYLIQTSA